MLIRQSRGGMGPFGTLTERQRQPLHVMIMLVPAGKR
jgi:hypothetical protein